MSRAINVSDVLGKWYQTLLDTSLVHAEIDQHISQMWAKNAADLSEIYSRFTGKHITPLRDEEFRIVTGEASHAIQETNEVALRLNISSSELSSLFLNDDIWFSPTHTGLMNKLSDLQDKVKMDRNLLITQRWSAHLREADARTPNGYLEKLGLSRSMKPSVAIGLIHLAGQGVPAEYILESGMLKSLTEHLAKTLAELYHSGVSGSYVEELVS